MAGSGLQNTMEHFLSPIEKTGIRASQPISDDLSQDFQSCLAAKVVTRRGFRRDDFISTMMGLWKFAKGLAVRTVADDTFLFRFLQQSDMMDVLNKEPWSFGGNLILLQQVGPASSLHDLDMRHVSFWVHAHRVPWLRMTTNTTKLIGDTLGTYVDVRSSEEFACIGGTLRIRIRLDAYKPLCRKTTIEFAEIGDKEVEFTYEKLPDFCAFCGLISHWTDDCPHKHLHPADKNDFLFTGKLREVNRMPKPRRFPKSTPVGHLVPDHISPSCSGVGGRGAAPAAVHFDHDSYKAVNQSGGGAVFQNLTKDSCPASISLGCPKQLEPNPFIDRPLPISSVSQHNPKPTEAMDESHPPPTQKSSENISSFQIGGSSIANTIDGLIDIPVHQGNLEEFVSLSERRGSGASELPLSSVDVGRQVTSTDRGSKRKHGDKRPGRSCSGSQQ